MPEKPKQPERPNVERPTPGQPGQGRTDEESGRPVQLDPDEGMTEEEDTQRQHREQPQHERRGGDLPPAK